MPIITARRRRLLNRVGRLLEFSRADGSVSATIRGFYPPPGSVQVDGSIQVSGISIQIGATELAAQPAGGYQSIMPQDKIADGGLIYTVHQALPVYDKGAICGWQVIAEGGS